MSDFIDSFTTKCLEKGKCKPREICEEAAKEIDRIDDELDRIYALRTQRDNYVSVMRSFGHDFGKSRGRRSKPPMVNPEISNADDDPSFLKLIHSVCEEVEKSDYPLTPRRLISGVGYEGSDPSPVYVSLKWLLDRGILKRNEDRAFLPGEKWDSRQTETANKKA